MAKYTTYLVGPMQDSKDGGVRWRERITPKLQALDVDVIDPTLTEAEEYGSIEEAHKVLGNYIATGNWDAWDAKLDDIIRRDMDAVHESDFIVAYYDPDAKMGGTLCEMWEASWHRKIPMYVVCHSPKKDWNMWMLRTVRSTGIVFDSWTQLTEFLTEKYGNTNGNSRTKQLAIRVSAFFSRVFRGLTTHLAHESNDRRKNSTSRSERLLVRLASLCRTGRDSNKS